MRFIAILFSIWVNLKITEIVCALCIASSEKFAFWERKHLRQIPKDPKNVHNSDENY